MTMTLIELIPPLHVTTRTIFLPKSDKTLKLLLTPTENIVFELEKKIRIDQKPHIYFQERNQINHME